MPKLKLEMDSLRVESFETHAGGRARGTVEGLSLVVGEAGNVPMTDDAKACLDSWINTCVTARISDCPGPTCDFTRCGPTCPTGDNPICCPPA